MRTPCGMRCSKPLAKVFWIFMSKPIQLLSVIIPVYNEKSTIQEVIERVHAVDLPIPKEIIVVDDGSSDGTSEILDERCKNLAKLYHSPKNTGKGSAVRIGLSLCQGEIILIQDADLELEPSEYKQLLQPIFDGKTSVVYGSRFLKNSVKIPKLRRLANHFLTSATNALYGTRLSDMETAYKVFESEIVKNLPLEANGFDIEPELTARISRAGYKIFEVPISYRPRTKFEGKKIRWRDGLKALWMLLKCRFD